MTWDRWKCGSVTHPLEPSTYLVSSTNTGQRSPTTSPRSGSFYPQGSALQSSDRYGRLTVIWMIKLIWFSFNLFSCQHNIYPSKPEVCIYLIVRFVSGRLYVNLKIIWMIKSFLLTVFFLSTYLLIHTRSLLLFNSSNLPQIHVNLTVLVFFSATYLSIDIRSLPLFNSSICLRYVILTVICIIICFILSIIICYRQPIYPSIQKSAVKPAYLSDIYCSFMTLPP